MREGASTIWVSELQSADGTCWNDDALNHNLLLLDVEAVKLIPLRCVKEDFWEWSAERHCLYTVRSACCILSEFEAHERAFVGCLPSHSEASRDLRWKKLWKQKVPPKVRVFWWRVMHDFMPSQASLNRQYIDPIANCESCGTPRETTFHTPVECPAAKEIWRRLKKIEGNKLPRLCPRSWATDLLDDSFCEEQERAVIIMCAMWSLWNARNDRNHGRTPIDPK
jgi:hypothetical protein